MIDTAGRPAGGLDAFAAIWQARVRLRFPDGQLHQVADYLATSARRACTVTVELDPYTVHRLLLAAGLDPDVLRQAVALLTEAGMLTQVHGRDGLHTLAMPSTLATGPGA